MSDTDQVNASLDYGPNTRPLQKKPSVNQGSGTLSASASGASAGVNQGEAIKKTKEQCEKVFNMLKGHPSIMLFVEPPDLTNPLFLQLSAEMDFMNLNNIEVKFKTG